MIANADWVPETALWSLGLAILTSLLGYLIGCSNGRRSQKAAEELATKNRISKAVDDFSVFMSRKQGEIPPVGVVDFYRIGKDGMRDQIFGIVPFLTRDQTSRVKAAWVAYCEIEDQLTNEEAGIEELRAEAARIDGLPAVQVSRDVLKRQIAALYDSVR